MNTGRVLCLALLTGVLVACGDARSPGSPDGGTPARSEPSLRPMPGEAAPAMVQVPERNPWRLAGIAGFALPSGARLPTLEFDPEAGRAAGFAGVNRYSGPYELGADSVEFADLVSTRMAGPPELMALEQVFLEALARVDGWRLRDGALELQAGGGTLLTFAPAETPLE